MELTAEQKKFIDDNFYEGLTDSELDKQKFELLTTPYELHYLADKHNWDDGVKLLQWIAESEICSEATALLIFWLSQPHEYQSYKLNQELNGKYQDYENNIFTLIKTIYQNYQNNFYKQADIHFDPSTYLEKEPPLPDFMKEATNGEEPYIYFEEAEVDSWFGEILKNSINRCTTAMELYNIAYFIKYNRNDIAKLILNHPLCDKGTALMLFWRLKTYSGLWHSEYPILNTIIEKIRNGKYKEELYYNPNEDKDIKIKEPKPKWTIPSLMMRKV